MFTDFFNILKNDSNVTDLFGSDPLRVFPFSSKLNGSIQAPYAVYGVFNSTPYNYLKGRVDTDLSGVQVDIYATNSSNMEDCFNAIRDAIDDFAYLTNYSTVDIDNDTGYYHVRMEIDFHVDR